MHRLPRGSCRSSPAVMDAGQVVVVVVAVAIAVGRPGYAHVLAGTVMVVEAAAVVDGVGEAVAASNDRELVAVSTGLLRPASAVAEARLALTGAILRVVEEPAEVLAARAH